MPRLAPDFYLGSSEARGDFARARSIRIEPPVIGQAFGLGGEDIHDLIVSPHYVGSTLFPISEYPMPVHIYRALTTDVFTRLQFDRHEVTMEAWGELYRTLDAAAAAGKSDW